MVKVQKSSIIIALFLTLFLFSCKSIELSRPEGFAEFETKWHSAQYKAISPEGVVFRVKTARNKPLMDLAFWSGTLKNQLVKEGYTLIEEGTFSNSGNDGTWYEWGAPLGNENYIYLTGILVVNDKIAVIEAAGPAQYFSLHRESIRNSLNSLVVH